jgi:hypothetical protein
MPLQDDLDPTIRARIAEAEERVRKGVQANSRRVEARELGRWIDELRATLERALDARGSRAIRGMGSGSDKAAG